MIPWFTRKRETSPSERIAAASKQLDVIRAHNLAKLAEPHSQAARKGWERRREVRS